MSTTTVKSFDTTDCQGARVSFTVDSQLLDYIEPARRFGAADLSEITAAQRYQPSVIAIPDHRSASPTPMLLSTGNDQTLHLIRRSAGGTAELPANYEMIDLSAGFAKMATGKVRAFAAGWTVDDRVTLAVAVETTLPGHPSLILIAYDVSTKDGDWSNLPWVSYGTRDTLRIDGMRVIREPDGAWLTLMSGSAGVLANAYVIRQGRPGNFQTGGMVYSTPIDLTDIADFQVGGFDGRSAMHVLGTNHGGKRVIVTRAIPRLDPRGNPIPTPFATFACPRNANVLAVGLNRARSGADLYVGGRGVQVLIAEDFDDQEEAEFTTVMPEAAAPSVERIVVAEAADGAATIWALDGGGRLLVATRQASVNRKTQPWGEPVLLRQGVREIAPVPGDRHISASVLIVYDKGETSSLVRDAQGIWQDEPITIADAAAATRLLTFQTVVALRTANGAPATGRVRLSASVPTTLLLNGHSHFVYPGNDAAVEIPDDGKITISNRALSFSPATYRVKVEGWKNAIDISPACRLYQRFDTLSAEELRQAKAPDGRPLLGAEFQSGGGQAGSLDSLVQSLKKASAVVTNKPGGKDGVWLVDEEAAFSSKVTATTLPDGYSWGLASDGRGGLQALGAADANALASRGGHASAGLFGLNVSLSDVWQTISAAAKEAVKFVVRKVSDVVEFVCEIGGKIGRFIMNTLEEIGSFFNWLWTTIKTAAEDVWNFLKFLFDWGDIIAVRDKMREQVAEQLTSLKKEVQSWKPIISEYFDSAIRRVQSAKTKRGFPVSDPTGGDPIEQSRKDGNKAADDTVNSGPGSWITEQFANISKSLITIEMPADVESGPDLMAIFIKQLDRLSILSRDIAGAIKSIFPDGWPSIADLTFEKLKDIVMAVGLNLAEGGLKLGKDICIAIVSGLAALIDGFRGIMFARIRVPILEKVWELVSGKTTDLSFSLIDAVLLPTALLSTIMFKLTFPKEDLREVLKASLPSQEVAAVQSNKWISLLRFLFDVGSVLKCFFSNVYDSFNVVGSIVQKQAGVWKWFCWVAGLLAHFATASIFLLNKAASSLVRLLEGLVWVFGFVPFVFKYRNQRLPALEQELYADRVQGLAILELIVHVVSVLMRSLAMLDDEDGNYPGMKIVYYYGTTGAKILNCAGLIVKTPKVKVYVALGSVVASLVLGLGAGYVQCRSSYTRWQAAT